MGIVGGSEDLVVALQVAGINRQIGLAEDNGASLAQPRDRPRIFFWNEIFQLRRARRSAHPGGLKGIFDRHRDAVQRTAHLATRERGISGVGLGAGAIAVDRHDAVDRLIKRCDARQKIVERLAAGNLAPSDFSRNSGSAQMGKLGHGGLLLGM